MTAPNLFNSLQGSFIQQDSLKHYRQQLSEKKSHLVLAKAAYHKAMALAEEFKQKIALANEQVMSLKDALDTTTNDEEKQKLVLQKIKLQDFIKNAPQRIAPVTQRLEHLTEGLQLLEKEITAIVEQVHESTRQQQKSNAPEA